MLAVQGTLELDYVTWKRGLEASFRLDLSNPCDLFIGEKLMQRAQVRSASDHRPGQHRTVPMHGPEPHPTSTHAVADVRCAPLASALSQAAESGGDGDGAEELRECKLDDEPFDTSSALPSQGVLQVVYFSTLQQDTISFAVELDLSQANGRAILLRLWERVLTTPTDFWAACTHNGADLTCAPPPLPEK